MLQRSLKKDVISAAISAAALMAFAGSAQARAVPIAWDPAYGGSFPSLGWEGTGTANYSDSCESLTGWVANSNACSLGSMSLSGLTLKFFDISNPSVILETISLSAPLVYEMYFMGGQLKGISTGFTAPVTSTLPIAELGGAPVWWHTKFEKEDAPVGTPTVQLYWTANYVDPACIAAGTCEGGGSANKAILTVVPEPATYALMFAGLLAVGAVARRRAQ